MSIERRVNALEMAFDMNRGGTVVVFWGLDDEDDVRRRVEEAQRRGCSIRVIVFGVVGDADNIEEAEAIVEAHREDNPLMNYVVQDRAPGSTGVLAAWDPGLPNWLVSAMGDQAPAGM